MTVPKPEQFNRSVATSYARIRQRLEDLPQLYKDAYLAGETPRVLEGAGKVARGGVSDEVAVVVGELIHTPEVRDASNRVLKRAQPIGMHAGIRNVLERIPKRLQECENILATIEQDIWRAMDRLNPPEGDDIVLPNELDPGDLDEAHAAQLERHRRGEGEVMCPCGCKMVSARLFPNGHVKSCRCLSCR